MEKIKHSCSVYFIFYSFIASDHKGSICSQNTVCIDKAIIISIFHFVFQTSLFIDTS